MEYLFLSFHLLFAFFIFFLTLAFITGAPFVPSTRSTANKMIELAHIQEGDIVYDLGSGDGRLLFLSADKGAAAIGFEINPLLVFWTWLQKTLSLRYKTGFNPVNHVTVRWNNFWNVNLSNADVVFIYLLPWRMEKLKKKLLSELKPGALVVSNSFIFPQWKVLRSDEKTHVYVFEVPKKTNV